jgi:hypothetical protein
VTKLPFAAAKCRYVLHLLARDPIFVALSHLSSFCRAGRGFSAGVALGQQAAAVAAARRLRLRCPLPPALVPAQHPCAAPRFQGAASGDHFPAASAPAQGGPLQRVCRCRAVLGESQDTDSSNAGRVRQEVDDWLTAKFAKNVRVGPVMLEHNMQCILCSGKTPPSPSAPGARSAGHVGCVWQPKIGVCSGR